MIPELRKAGYYVERFRRPLSRGMKYRVYRRPDETVGIVYSMQELKELTAHLLDGGPRPKPRMLQPSGYMSAIVRPRCRYL
jgi:hypothetical protein